MPIIHYSISDESKHVSIAAPGATIGHTLSSSWIWASITTGLPAESAVYMAASNSSTVVAFMPIAPRPSATLTKSTPSSSTVFEYLWS